MATKKKNEDVKAEELDQEPDGTHGGSWDIMETIAVPRAPKGEDQTYFVSINGRNFWVPKGKTVTAPRPVVVAIRESIARDALAADYADEISREAVELK